MLISHWLQKKPMKMTPSSYRKLFVIILSSLSRFLLFIIYLYWWVQISLHDLNSLFGNNGLIFNIQAFHKWQCILLFVYCIPAALKKPHHVICRATLLLETLANCLPQLHKCLSSPDTTSLKVVSDMIHNQFQRYFIFNSYKIKMKSS